MLHRFIFFIGTVAVVVVACTVDKTSGSDDDDTGSTTNAASSSTGPGITETCEEQCQATFPNGVTDYHNVRLCLVCWSCGDKCKEEHRTNVCEDGVGQAPEGCSAQFPTCQECIESDCSLVQNPDTSFAGVCGPIASICSANPDCVRMNNCVADCVAAGATSSMASSGSGVASSATGGV